MAGVRDNELVLNNGFVGLNNVDSENAAPGGSLRTARNVDLDNAGKPRRRRGYALTHEHPSARSLWASSSGYGVFAVGFELYQFSPSYAPRVVATVHPLRNVAYADVNGVTYFSDGNSVRRLLSNGSVLPLVPSVGGFEVAVSDGGVLPAGRYNIAVTAYDGAGVESGAAFADTAIVADNGRIDLTLQLPTASDVGYMVFASDPNGEVLYQRARLLPGMSAYSISLGERGRALETAHMAQIPAGHLLEMHNAQLVTAMRRQLWYSEPFRFGLCKMTSNFILHEDDITGMASIGDGLFVGLGNTTLRYAGADMSQLERNTAYPHGVVPGTMTKVPGSYFAMEGVESMDYVAHWVATNGAMCIGLTDGRVIPYSEGAVLASGYEGAAGVIERNGIRQVLTNMRSAPDAVATTRDQFSARVYRNGVPLE